MHSKLFGITKTNDQLVDERRHSGKLCVELMYSGQSKDLDSLTHPAEHHGSLKVECLYTLNQDPRILRVVRRGRMQEQDELGPQHRDRVSGIARQVEEDHRSLQARMELSVALSLLG